jgi:excisionase family DNA binding protein
MGARDASLNARRAGAEARRTQSPKPLVYTAQDVARFCEVDLKTIHHWADGGKIRHHRTDGRHLRFRRNHVIAFLRSHGYPIHAQIGTSKPSIFLTVPPKGDAGAPPLEDVAKKLASRFFVRKFESALGAIAHLVASQPDALVVSDADPTWNVALGVRALKAHPETAWPLLIVVATSETHEPLKQAGADFVVGSADVARLHLEIARLLEVD